MDLDLKLEFGISFLLSTFILLFSWWPRNSTKAKKYFHLVKVLIKLWKLMLIWRIKSNDESHLKLSTQVCAQG